MTPKMYADGIQKSMGLDSAFDFAKRVYEGTRPENWSSLPLGPIFYDKLENSNRLREKPLRKLYHFWQNVFGILNQRVTAKENKR